MKFRIPYSPQIVGSLAIVGLLYFGSFWILCSIHLPPKLVVAGKAATIQIGPGKQTNDATVEVPFNLQGPLNYIYTPLNRIHRRNTGFGIYFAPKAAIN